MLKDIGSGIARLNKPTDEDGEYVASSNPDFIRDGSIFDIVEARRLSLARLRPLADKMSTSSGYLEKLDMEIVNASDIEDQYNKNFLDLETESKTFGTQLTSSGARILTPEQAKALGDIYERQRLNSIAGQDFEVRSSHLTRELLHDAELASAKSSRNYDICTWISYGLFGIGWILGFGGRMSGTETSIPSE